MRINLPWQKKENASEETSDAQNGEQPVEEESSPDTIRRCANPNCRKPLSSKSKYDKCESCREKEAGIARRALRTVIAIAGAALSLFLGSRITKRSK